ncbi:MAG: Sec-independent protein translocase protein TatB [Thermodesulfobacteriota bacterium]
MFGIGFTELLLVLVVALLVLGPDKLPEVARTAAKAYNDLRRTGLDLKRTVTDMDISGLAKEDFSVKDKRGEKSSAEHPAAETSSAEASDGDSGKAT